MFSSIIDRIKQEGDTEAYDMFHKNKDWCRRVNTDPKFNRKIIETMHLTSGDDKRGVEVRVEGWLNGRDVISVNYSFLERYLIDNNRGPMVGSMGSVVWVGHTMSNLFLRSLHQLLPLLKKIEYAGPISVDCTIDEDKIYINNIIAGLSYSTVFVLLEMYKGRIGKLTKNIALHSIDKMEFKSKLGIGIDLVVLPDYGEVEVIGLNKFNLKHFWGWDIDKRGNKYFSCNEGRIGTITARGDDIAGFSPLRDAKRRVMRTLSNLSIKGLIYRSDIGSRYESDYNTLKSGGWL